MSIGGRRQRNEGSAYAAQRTALAQRAVTGAGMAPAARRGRLALLAAVALSVLTMVGVGALWFGGVQGANDSLRPERGPAAEGSTQRGQVPGGEPAEEPRIDEFRTDFGPTQAITVDERAAWKYLDRSFEGTGTLIGSVEVAGGGPYPEHWTLVIEPTKFALGGDIAARRVIEMAGGQRTFEEHDLPLGGYRVSVEAAGLTSRPQEVMLYKIKGQEHLPGKSRVLVTLQFQRTGFIDGAILDADGAIVEDLLVTLTNLATQETRETATSPAGVWRLEDIRAGRYRITFGNPARPLVPAEEFTFTGSEQRRPLCTVPVTSSIRFRVVDGMGRVLPDAKVRGVGTGGGTVDVITGPNGEALARFLLPGSYNVRVSDPEQHSGKLSFHLEGNEVEQLMEIPCRPKR